MQGLSGGTGSGIFEEVAAHARYVCEVENVYSVRVFGYLFLPDTMEELAGRDPAAMSCMYANGYAALKELENYMSMPFNRERKEKFAGAWGRGFYRQCETIVRPSSFAVWFLF